MTSEGKTDVLNAVMPASPQHRMSEESIAVTEAFLNRFDNVYDTQVPTSFVAQNLAVMTPSNYGEWIKAMNRNYCMVSAIVGFNYPAGPAQLCGLVQGLPTLRRRVKVTEAQELPLLCISLFLMGRLYRRVGDFFYNNIGLVTLKDSGLAALIASIPDREIGQAIQRLESLLESIDLAQLRPVDVEEALKGDLTPVLLEGAL